MTLAACFRIHGTPVLFADLLVSKIGKVEDHEGVPTNIDPSLLLPNDWLRIIKGVTRKTIQIADTFVAAGAGNIIAIRTVFNELRRADKSSLEDVAALASLFQELDLGKLDFEICGWQYIKANDELKTFFWRYKDEFDSGGNHVIGSGADDFRAELATHLHEGEPIEINEVQGRLGAIETAGHMIGEQQFTGFGLASLFGGGAEVLVYFDHQFRPIDKIAHVHWWANGMKLDLPPRLLLNQFYSGNCLVLNSIWGAGEHAGRQEWFCAKPLDAKARISKNLIDKPRQPEYFVNFCMTAFEEPKFGFVVSALHDPKNMYMRIERNKNGVALDFHGERLADILRAPMEQLQEIGQRPS